MVLRALLHEEDLRKGTRATRAAARRVSKHREFKTVDESYVSQIPQSRA